MAARMVLNISIGMTAIWMVPTNTRRLPTITHSLPVVSQPLLRVAFRRTPLLPYDAVFLALATSDISPTLRHFLYSASRQRGCGRVQAACDQAAALFRSEVWWKGDGAQSTIGRQGDVHKLVDQEARLALGAFKTTNQGALSL